MKDILNELEDQAKIQIYLRELIESDISEDQLGEELYTYQQKQIDELESSCFEYFRGNIERQEVIRLFNKLDKLYEIIFPEDSPPRIKFQEENQFNKSMFLIDSEKYEKNKVIPESIKDKV